MAIGADMFSIWLKVPRGIWSPLGNALADGTIPLNTALDAALVTGRPAVFVTGVDPPALGPGAVAEAPPDTTPSAVEVVEVAVCSVPVVPAGYPVPARMYRSDNCTGFFWNSGLASSTTRY